MIRWLYSFLIRRHPARFRQRFGDQMQSTFDESVRERNGYRLLMDAGISLLRQWLLRSEYRSRPERRVFAGGMPSLDEIHRLSDQLQKKANRVNLAWVLSVMPLLLVVAAVVNPATTTFVAQGFYLVLPASIFFSLYMLGLRCSKSINTFTSIHHSSHSAQTELKRKRDGFEMWIERTGLCLIICMLTWVSPVLLAFLLRQPNVVQSWPFVHSIVFGVETLVFFIVVKRPNERAVEAVQQEIEAGDL